jgi:hypothetical protein
MRCTLTPANASTAQYTNARCTARYPVLAALEACSHISAYERVAAAKALEDDVSHRSSGASPQNNRGD